MGLSSGVRRRVGRATTSRAIAVVVAALCAVAGCSSAHTPTATGTVVHVTERDFRVVASPTHLVAGNATLTVENRGPDSHELIVVRKGTGTLPLRADGVTINEEALAKVEVGALEPGAPGSRRVLHVHLRPGTYELFCNMSGHYFGGMHTDVVVT